MNADDLWRAFDDVIAIAQEHRGDGASTIEQQLSVHGVDADALREVLAERWEAYRKDFDPANPHLIFVQAMTEGLLAGLKLRRDE